jgi:hypothetical protein
MLAIKRSLSNSLLNRYPKIPTVTVLKRMTLNLVCSRGCEAKQVCRSGVPIGIEPVASLVLSVLPSTLGEVVQALKSV